MFMGIYVCQWVSWVSKCLWVFTGLYGYLWVFMSVMGFYGCLWVSGCLGIYGFSWVYIGVYGCL